MRRAWIVVLALFAVAGFAGELGNRDALLTPDGTLYTVAPESIGPLGYSLRLTAQKGEERTSSIVPATDGGGYHKDPSLAYDPEADTLFLFWQTVPAPMSSSLLVVAYQNGTWTEPVEFAAGAFRLQWNLRIAVTRYLEDEQSDGSVVRRRQSIIHAVWWEEDGDGEAARYAMLTIESGKIAVFDVRDAITLLPEQLTKNDPEPQQIDLDLLRQPAIFEHPTSDAVDVIFADLGTTTLNRVEVRPRRGNGSLRPPIGRGRGRIGAPPMSRMSAQVGRVDVLPGRPGSDSLIFYFESGDRLNYLLYSNSKWSELQSIVLSEAVTREVGVTVMRKLLASE